MVDIYRSDLLINLHLIIGREVQREVRVDVIFDVFQVVVVGDGEKVNFILSSTKQQTDESVESGFQMLFIQLYRSKPTVYGVSLALPDVERAGGMQWRQ